MPTKLSFNGGNKGAHVGEAVLRALAGGIRSDNTEAERGGRRWSQCSSFRKAPLPSQDAGVPKAYFQIGIHSVRSRIGGHRPCRGAKEKPDRQARLPGPNLSMKAWRCA